MRTEIILRYYNIIDIRSDPRVVAVLELIFVRKGSMSLSLDFADVNSFITLLCTSCTI